MRKLKTKLEKRHNKDGIGRSIIYSEIEEPYNISEDEIVKTKTYNKAKHEIFGSEDKTAFEYFNDLFAFFAD